MVTFVEYFGIKAIDFEKTKAFNVKLDEDSQLYIDPVLVRKCDVLEFANSADVLTNYFTRVLRLVKLIKKEGNQSWKAAKSLLTFREIKGTCIGYSRGGTRGNSIGQKFSSSMMDLARDAIESGREDPIIFEYASIFQDGIGSDRISDMITNILYESILEYTQRVERELGLHPDVTISFRDKHYSLINNPFNKQPVLLLPFTILSKLPLAESCRDIDHVCSVNSINRQQMSRYVHFNEKSRSIPKNEMKNAFLHNEEFRQMITVAIKHNGAAVHTDQNLLEPKVKDIVEKIPNFGIVSDLEGLISFVESVNSIFKNLVENNGIRDLIYDDGKAKEKRVQSLYFAIAETKAIASEVDVSKENNNGRGPVDFKLSSGHSTKVLVEIKLTSNSKIKHGLEVQLPEYLRSECAKYAYYLVIDADERGFDKVHEIFDNFHNDEFDIRLVTVDGNRKLSASRF